MPVTSFDIYKIVFMAELLVSECLFVFRLKRRRMFALRAALSVFVCLASAVFVPVVAYNAAYTSFLFVAFFVVTLLCAKFCFAESWYNVFFCCIAAYTIQHLAYELFNYISSVSGIGTSYSDNIYSGSAPVVPDAYTVIMYFGIYATVYWLMFVLFGTRVRKAEEMSLRGGWMLFLAAMIILVDIVFNAVTVYEWYENPNAVYRTVVFLYNIVCCPLALIVQFGLLSRKNLEKELYAVRSLRRMERKQYYVSKESMDLINRKCHDIKFQLRRYGRDMALGEDAIKDLEEAVSIYDTSVKTGNTALDSIIGEKNMFCKMNGIKFTCMADGAALSFMREVDIYSLFGNMLENAVDAVGRLDEANRIIGLVVRREHDMVSVNAYNYYSGDLVMKDGLPVTSKGDPKYHGYGMRSIEAITDKYGGSVSVAADDGIFRLNIMLPVTRSGQPDMETGADAETPEEEIAGVRAGAIVIPPALIAAFVSFGLLIISCREALTAVV